MKIHVTSILLAVLLVLGSITVADANGGPHGGYNDPSTDACAGCHRTHTATFPGLLVGNDTMSLCLSCHDTPAGGATTSVTRGVWTTGSTNLLGGGFTTYKGVAVTSVHDLTTGVSAWGNGGVRGAATALSAGFMNCASCHDPHGSTNYRIIRTVVNNVPVNVAQVDEATKNYSVEHWAAGQSNLCAACHSAYHQTQDGSGSNPAALTGSGGYAHQIDMPYNQGSNAGKANPETAGFLGVTLPLADGVTANTVVVCQTCHLPHGTSASMTTLALAGPTADSALLRENNRAVCEACHQK